MAKKQNMRRIRRRILVMVAALGLLTLGMAVVMVASAFKAEELVKEVVDPAELRSAIEADSLRAVDIMLLPVEPDSTFLRHLDEMPGGGERLSVDRTIRLGREFSDKNPAHLSSAIPLGIRPLQSLSDAWLPSRRIVKIESNADYFVDSLTHSLPYLVPEAAQLLSDITAAFSDSLQARGGGAYRVKVTSLLRTESTVKRLRRRNVNATSHSAHLYGTTFDLSYSNFVCDSLTVPRTTEDLKFLLAEVLRDFRDRGRCWVKHERKQSCFHITARK